MYIVKDRRLSLVHLHAGLW